MDWSDSSVSVDMTLNDLSEKLLECVLSNVSYITIDTSCNLLVAMIKRGDSIWRNRALEVVKEKVNSCCVPYVMHVH